MSYVSGDLSDIRNSLNRRQNLRGSMLEDHELREILSKDASELVLSRAEPSQEDNVLLHKDSIEYEKFEYRNFRANVLLDDPRNPTKERTHVIRESPQDAVRSPVYF